MIEVTVAHLGLDRTTNTPVVILREKDGSRVLPIWIGPAEASAIAMELQGMKAQRPLTHDLLKQILVGLGGDLRRVVISAVKENTYFAELLIRRDDHVFQVDARPSDSIALALRMRAPDLHQRPAARSERRRGRRAVARTRRSRRTSSRNISSDGSAGLREVQSLSAGCTGDRRP